ncbi:hypothetical protein FSP39_009878 [Pinctada imbricata]|uniref:Uncharacterized protein n=1 Tax=Pinctada imbricata TaxID=66713 RepID=A0AA88YBH6_PINIB|nr:hypothetical protein FSP39_009878 [Pinctada imbricata]
MVSEGTLFNNIPKVAKAYTNNNRRKVQKIMKGILNLILQGVKVELTYLSLNNMTLDYKIRKRLWDKKIRQVIDHMQKFDEQMEKDWFSSLSKDVKKTLADKTGKSNDEFADALYSEISDKYDWREFHVIAYDEIAKDGYKKHYLKRCGGVHWFKKGGRNTVVASNDKAKPVMNRQHTESALRGVKTRRKHWISWKRKRSAMDVFNDLKAMRPAFMNCGYYASFGVIDKGQKIVHRANKKRLVTVQSNNFQLFAYG